MSWTTIQDSLFDILQFKMTHNLKPYTLNL